ncbi:hypothetical protein PHMEG_00020178 [Phytophthora megakarya]|uniref:Uncharacterized protein n=1 Tax=Phytophthora megakarya TaxID=4795 RepID=A0A225VSD8_9STRA|nr:hypothetical protein PHMEG_00020178 [Phytophthora megakarya]
MVKWRQQKKAALESLIQECQRLEDKLQLCVAVTPMTMEHYNVHMQHPVHQALRQLTIQHVDLRREYRLLKEALDGSTVPTRRDALGWRVYFTDGSPSFHFNPFSKTDFDAILDESEAAQYSYAASIGNILDWKVDYSPVTEHSGGGSFIAHARFSKRLRCTLDHSERMVISVDPSLLPVLTTAKNWGRVPNGNMECQPLQQFERMVISVDPSLLPVLTTANSWGRVPNGNMECQPLQQFGKHAYVTACNIPSDVHLRYICLARHTRKTREDGVRMDKYTLLIADSKANAYNRLAEEEQHEVQWVLDGRTSMTLTEVDDSTIDVVYDQWGTCLNKEYGQQLYVDWIRFVVHLEQLVSPARLLQTCPIRIPGVVTERHVIQGSDLL